MLPEYLQVLNHFASEETLENIHLNQTWTEIVDRMSEFAVMAKPEFSIFLKAVGDTCRYNYDLERKEVQLTKGTPRVYRSFLHKIIEGVRLMRASIEEKSPSSLDDFDEMAAEVQRTHDDFATNIYYDSVF